MHSCYCIYTHVETMVAKKLVTERKSELKILCKSCTHIHLNLTIFE